METKMKTTSLALSALLLAGSLGLASYANAATTLTAANGMTVYVFDKDVGGTPSCYAECAKTWPAYTAKAGEKIAKGWSEVKRTDGSLQWAYDAKPLYFYAPDKKKGDMLGDGIGGIWHIVSE
jgi:predicted lipoprotein with Yx(FWY)xxD motif